MEYLTYNMLSMSHQPTGPIKDGSSSSPVEKCVNCEAPAQVNSALPTSPESTIKPRRKYGSRTARACLACHARRKRCRRTGEEPCDNCKNSGIECCLPDTSSRRRLRVTSDPGVDTVFESVAQDVIAGQTLETPENESITSGSSCTSESADTNRTALPTSLLKPSHTTSPSVTPLDCRLKYTLPCFLRPLPSTLPPEDSEYLAMKGVLEMPPGSIRGSLLQAYIEYVHPNMPVLNLHECISIIHGLCRSYGQISLLLYRAIMFSATFFVDIEYVYEAGYSTRRAMSKDFFDKTRLLYDLDCEPDQFIQAQALLLMSHWYESPNSQKDGWHWLGLAIATLEGLAATAKTYEYTNQRQWKRLWWSCYVHDRLLSLTSRRPTRLNNISFHVDLLLESDFEIMRLDGACIISSEIPTFMANLEMQRQSTSIFISLAELCTHLDHVLQTRYLLITPVENEAQGATMLYPKQLSHINYAEVEAVNNELISWAMCLPSGFCWMSTQFPTESSSMIVQKMFLHILFYTALALLHRGASFQTQAPSKAYDAAIQIFTIVQYLHQRQLEKLLPSSAVGSILTASMVYLAEDSRQFKATRGFRMNEHVLGELSKVYTLADHAITISKAAAASLGVTNA